MNPPMKNLPLILIIMMFGSVQALATEDCAICWEPNDPTLVFQGADPCKPMADGTIDSRWYGRYLCCGGVPYRIWWWNSFDSCCDTDGNGVAETPYDSEDYGCCPKGPNTTERMVVELSCEDGDGNKICPNCDSDGDGVYDDCLAVNPKDANGNPLDDCAAAAQAGVSTAKGAVICKDGNLIACVLDSNFQSGNPSDAIRACAQCHEDMHLSNHNLYCTNSCGWGVAGGNDWNEECQAWGATAACLQRKVENGEIDENDPDYKDLIQMSDDNESWCNALYPGYWESDEDYCDSY